MVGAGQSTSEIFMDLHGRPNAPQVDLIMRARAIRAIRTTAPFRQSAIFQPGLSPILFFSRANKDRAALLDEFWHTNCVGPDLVLIEQIF